ncbi:MAG: dihydrolipoyl dehydrogenase [Thermodesulfobacteriota bacterium]
MSEYDIAIIGGGPGGYVAAIRGAQLGARVCLIERERVGGTCLNRGCIPTKALYASATALAATRRAGEFGVHTGELSFDLSRAVSRKDGVVEQLVSGVEQLLKANGVDLLTGDGFIESPGRVRVERGREREVVAAKKIIVATGSEPASIPGVEPDGEGIVTTTEALNLTEVPDSLLIIGGGVAGCEFATIFAEFGSEVTIVEFLPTILSSEERTVSRLVARSFKERGVSAHTGVTVESSERVDEGVRTRLSDGRELLTEKVLVTTGRTFNSGGLGLDGVGVVVEAGKIPVNVRMETSVAGIYAIGDVTGGILLAHVASQEGIVAVNNALAQDGGKEMEMDYSAIPSAIFTNPEIASVGLKEAEAKAQGIAFKVGRFPYGANGKALAMGEEDGFVQVVVDAATDRVIGASIVGAHATDLIGEVALAVKTGLKASDIIETIHAHPTLPEIIQEAVEDSHGMAIHKAGRRRR